MIYHVALHMSCLHLFTAPLPFLSLSTQELQQVFKEEVRSHHRKSSAIVTAHSLAVQTLFVLAAAFLRVASMLDILL